MPLSWMVLNTTTRFVHTIPLEILPSQLKSAAQHFLQNLLLLLQRQCREAKSTLPGLIIQPLRQVTRLNERKHRMALILRLPRWVQMCTATAIQPDSNLTQHIITESELPTGRLIQITQMNRMLKLCREVT